MKSFIEIWFEHRQAEEYKRRHEKSLAPYLVMSTEDLMKIWNEWDAISAEGELAWEALSLRGIKGLI
jgi:hypothetical protein